MAVRPGYFAKEAFSNIKRNVLMFTAAILAVSISLLLVGSVFMLVRVVRNITFQFRNDVQINVFIRDEANSKRPRVETMYQQIDDMPEVSRIDYVSKKMAYEEFVDLFANQPAFIEAIDEETLPASFRVSLHDTDDLELVSNRIEKIADVDEVKNALESVEKVSSVLRVLSLGVLSAAGILVVAAAVLISNTIRLAIFARRREIAIMKLVGATNWFIRWPFILEGLAQGVFGAGVAVLLLAGLKRFAIDLVEEMVPFVPLGISDGWMFLTFAAVLFTGSIVAVLGTVFSLRKYLEV